MQHHTPRDRPDRPELADHDLDWRHQELFDDAVLALIDQRRRGENDRSVVIAVISSLIAPNVAFELGSKRTRG
jgi:hypothetical protein